MHPVVILIDPQSFGSGIRLEKTIAGLRKWKIPFLVIQKGDDIREKLETGF